jgi:hypothetical protein
LAEHIPPRSLLLLLLDEEFDDAGLQFIDAGPQMIDPVLVAMGEQGQNSRRQ